MISCILSIFFSLFLLQQEEPFPKDEFGKYTLMEVTEVIGYSREQLFKNADAWAKETFKKRLNTRDSATWTITAAGNFVVHNTGSMKKHPDGVVEFEFTIEIKEARYRYTITNYIFVPYERNRYAKFEPDKSKSVPLEHEPATLNKGNWNGYVKTAHSKSLSMIEQLADAILVKDTPSGKKVKRNDSW